MAKCSLFEGATERSEELSGAIPGYASLCNYGDVGHLVNQV